MGWRGGGSRGARVAHPLGAQQPRKSPPEAASPDGAAPSAEPDSEEPGSENDLEGQLPIDGVLDLHHFAPRDVAAVVDAYLDECHAHGLGAVRLIHGKGKGVLRRTVHSVLERRQDVLRYGLASDRSGWGATLVELNPVRLANQSVTPPEERDP